MKKSLFTAGLLAVVTSSAMAATKMDGEAALGALNQSVSFAEDTIRLAQGQEAVNRLTASVAQAELSLALVDAEEVIRQGQAQEAINMLTASIANAEVSIALADATQLIDSVSDSQMLAELDLLLNQDQGADASDMIMAVVSERPALASAVMNVAVGAGQEEALVAATILSVLDDLPATAAGK